MNTRRLSGLTFTAGIALLALAACSTTLAAAPQATSHSPADTPLPGGAPSQQAVPSPSDAHLTITPPRAAPGDSVSLVGSGLAPDHDYAVSIGLSESILPLMETSDSQGSFRQTWLVPTVNAPPGSYQFCIYVKAGWPPQSPALACATLTLVPAQVPASARLVLTPAQASPGAYVTVSGSGFAPGHSYWVTVPTPLPAAGMPIPETADSQGSFQGPKTPVGNAPPGTYDFCVQDTSLCATLTVTGS